MLDIGFQEILVLMVLALLVFGPDKLPELGRRLGRAMREFRRASDEFRSTIETNLQLNEDSILPASSEPPASGAIAEAPSSAIEPVATGLTTSDGAEASPAGSEGEAGPLAEGGGEPLEPYWTRRGGRLLHRSDCAWRRRVPDAERVAIKAFQDGRDLGLEPCPVCAPREVEVSA